MSYLHLFFVIATQNPIHQIGTYPLPESQLDRFLLRIHLGFPDKQAERDLLKGDDRRSMIEHLKPILNHQSLIHVQKQATQIKVSDAILDYIQAILDFSRTSSHFEFGLSPRGGLALLNASKAWALMEGKDFVLPEHVKTVLSSVVNHRLISTSDEHQTESKQASDIIAESIAIS